MNYFSEEQLSRIAHLVREIEKLNDVEKLFLYLQLPCGRADASDVNNKSQRFNGSTGSGLQKSLDLFSKKPDQETTQTYTWILSHLEIDPNVSLPKQEVYDEYRAFCQANRFEPLCVADFGKAMKHAFPCIKPRRLGQRGNSRYCYSGLRKKYKIQPPNLPDIVGEHEQVVYCMLTNCEQTNNLPSTSSSSSSTGNSNNSSNNFNESNMTIKNTSTNMDDSTECQVPNSNKRLNYNRAEVINLKIEPNNHHQLHAAGHNPMIDSAGLVQFNEDSSRKQMHTNYSFQLDNIGQQVNRAHHHQPPSQQQHYSAGETPSAGSYDANTLGHPPHHHSRYTDLSSRTIQQPGTPDDDDYRHNYQDMPPLSGHFLGSTTTQVTLQPAHSDQSPQSIQLIGGRNNQTGHFSYQQPFGPILQSSSLDTSSSTTDVHSSMMQQTNDGKYINSVIQSQPPFNGQNNAHLSIGSQVRHAAQVTSNSVHLINHQISQMDACASPFQSPASTPYPTMSGNNYPMQDVMQDYCSSGCRLYQST